VQSNIKFSGDIVPVGDLKAKTEELTFLRGVVRGLMDIKEGREVSLADVKKRFGMNE
jgi:hypothetical protein